MFSRSVCACLWDVVISVAGYMDLVCFSGAFFYLRGYM